MRRRRGLTLGDRGEGEKEDHGDHCHQPINFGSPDFDPRQHSPPQPFNSLTSSRGPRHTDESDQCQDTSEQGDHRRRQRRSDPRTGRYQKTSGVSTVDQTVAVVVEAIATELVACRVFPQRKRRCGGGCRRTRSRGRNRRRIGWRPGRRHGWSVGRRPRCSNCWRSRRGARRRSGCGDGWRVGRCARGALSRCVRR